MSTAPSPLHMHDDHATQWSVDHLYTMFYIAMGLIMVTNVALTLTILMVKGRIPS